MNHDGVNWLAEQPQLASTFGTVCIDEMTAFKNRRAARSTAINKVLSLAGPANRIGISGTPNSNFITDIWHPVFLIDGGDRLSESFMEFQDTVCIAVYNPHATKSGAKWEPKQGAEEDVALLLSDINIRYTIDECLDLPEQSTRTYVCKISKPHRQAYNEYRIQAMLEIGDQVSSAKHAGVKVHRLLQTASGIVYDDDGQAMLIDTQRMRDVVQMVEDREHPCLVVFQWKPQKRELEYLLGRVGIPYGVIDGSVPQQVRTDCIRAFQEGKLKVLLIQPQAAAHGLTLTAASTVVWVSPTYSPELYIQTNARVRRPGQKRNTEVIHMMAPGTVEGRAYAALQLKIGRIQDMLKYLWEL